MDMMLQAMELDMANHMLQMKCNFMMMESGGIHPGQIAMLMTMKNIGPSSQRILAKKMNCSPASIAVSVKRLERAGLLEKQADEQDMRTTRVTLTQQGMEFAGKCESLVDKVASRKYGGFSDEDMARLNDYLSRIQKNLEIFYSELAGEKEHRERKQE
ncbi:MarR family winged helix-turn-helix transcriptional regulator [Bacilliculturomica massiliensis]|uniref:MarR family winged helix-turn-helix transcriptional regulator n=1 Tax=Bacilliculturomica massiliensis TaxID=1917867 RepID=UPI0013EEFCE2|nr:MarR family transcriptional regulator [Bacilliculturomica massiliensis]